MKDVAQKDESGIGCVSERPCRKFSRLAVDDTLSALETTRQGLSQNEASRRFALFGANRLPGAPRKPWFYELTAKFVHFFALMLWTAALLAWLAGLPQLSWAIIIVIFVNGLFSYWQEYQAERAAEALQALLPHQVRVRRNGLEKLISGDAVVRGDILILSEGETILADARLISAESLRLDLSSLTGESRPVPRSTNANPDSKEPIAFSPNLVFAGTSVAHGRGEAVVFAIGADTEFGRIAGLTQAQTKEISPLETEIRRVTRIVTILAVGLGAIFYFVGVLLGGLSSQIAFIFALGIIVANVPEGLLPTLTLSLAFAVRRMAKRKALVKRLSAVETLGATTVILTDKTGTLTENEMTVRELWTFAGYSTVSAGGLKPADEVDSGNPANWHSSNEDLLLTAALCCDAQIGRDGSDGRITAIGDPTEAAILVAADTVGLTRDVLKHYARLSELPFDSVRKRMSTIELIDDRPTVCVKGALLEILRLCTKVSVDGKELSITDEHRRLICDRHDSLADRGRRMLSVARRLMNDKDRMENGEWSSSDIERNLVFLGLIAMEDPPRAEVGAAIKSCREAGIRVIMVTGDDGLTASAIGREIGLHEKPPQVITGPQLNAMDEIGLANALGMPDILFARVSAEHKLRLVETCQKLGEIVAVTGDGVNDAPALKKADIGVAMGATGTDVAREASDMVLTDDNFASIVYAVLEGRAVYDNIRKFIGYVFVSNAAEMVPFVVFVLFGVPLPLTIMQILSVDVGTDLFPALALGAEKPEPDIMIRPPRKKDEGLLNVPTLLRCYLWLGGIEAGLSLLGFFWVQWLAGWRPGTDLIAGGPVYITATTVTFAGIVMAQIGNAFAWRSERQSVFRQGLFSNSLLLWCICAELLLMLFLIYLPPLAAIFEMAPPTTAHLLLIVTFGPILLLLEETRKLFVRTAAGISRARRSVKASYKCLGYLVVVTNVFG